MREPLGFYSNAFDAAGWFVVMGYLAHAGLTTSLPLAIVMCALHATACAYCSLPKRRGPAAMS